MVFQCRIQLCQFLHKISTDNKSALISSYNGLAPYRRQPSSRTEIVALFINAICRHWTTIKTKAFLSHWGRATHICVSKLTIIIPPASTKLIGGILVSPCPSVRLSVCGQNRVRSVSSTILIGSISYLHILSSNFRRCVACNARFKIQKFEILANF